jgi:hypothetical protein
MWPRRMMFLTILGAQVGVDLGLLGNVADPLFVADDIVLDIHSIAKDLSPGRFEQAGQNPTISMTPG